MTVRANKPAFNIREKLKELERPIGLKGSELMSADTSQEARDLVSAGRKNKIINGSMIIDQRHSGASNTNSNGYHTDRFRTQVSGADQLVQTYQQVADGPPGFKYSLKITTTTPETSVDSNEFLSVYTKMEGLDLQDLAYGTNTPKTITVSFYVKSSITGKFVYTIFRWEPSGHRAINFTYTIDSANTWERKSITIPGDTVRAISNDTSDGPWWNVWHLMSGSSYEGNASPTWNVYNTANWSGYNGTDAICTTNGATWQITGVQLEVGKNATEFEHRPYGEELALCQRYYYEYPKGNTYNIIANGFANTTTNALFHFQYPVPMRSAPVVATSGNWQVIDGTSHNVSGFSAITDSTELTGRVDATSSGLTVGGVCMLRNNNDANATFGFNAEL